MRGLRRKFSDAVGEDLDSCEVQVGNVLIRLARFPDRFQFGRGIFRQHLRKRRDLRIEFTMIGQHFVSLQHVIARNRIEPRRNAEAVVVFQSSTSRRK